MPGGRAIQKIDVRRHCRNVPAGQVLAETRRVLEHKVHCSHRRSVPRANAPALVI